MQMQGIFCADNEPCEAIHACMKIASYGEYPSSNDVSHEMWISLSQSGGFYARLAVNKQSHVAGVSCLFTNRQSHVAYCGRLFVNQMQILMNL